MKRLSKAHGMPNKDILTLEKELEAFRSKPSGSEIVSVLNKLANASLKAYPVKAKAYVLEALDLAEKHELPVEQAISYRILGIINREAGNFTEAMSYCRKSMDIYETLGDKNNMAVIHGTIAMIYRDWGLIDKTLEHYHESLRLKQEYGVREEELALCYFNIGSCFNTLDRRELAKSFYEYAESLWEKSGNLTHFSLFYHNLGVFYGKNKDYDRAREYFHKALDIREERGDKRKIASTLGNLGYLHSKLGDSQSALDCYARSLDLYEELDNKRGIAYTCGSAGGVHIRLGHLDKAEEFILRGLEIARKFKIKDREIHCLEESIDLYEAKGDLQKALMYSRELNSCKEEHLNEKSIEKIAGLQVQFETEKKEKEAEIYRLKNVELSRMNDQLRGALTHVKKLQGLLPICANCKKVRDDDGYWQQIECYISENSDAEITHGICPECMIKLYGETCIQE
ncbi:MAG: tetratricopeptide repeat protein [Candidatus Sabulitectum sp.]|nr:tetratricopeptide repeat protein [Candidatus Sabulitectum sp.]